MEYSTNWHPIMNQNDVDELNKRFCDFKQALFVDLKYYSADQVNIEVPDDLSAESRCYVKFQSLNPEIAADKDKNEVVFKFVGIRQLGVMAGRFNKGNVVTVNFSQNLDGSIMMEIFNNDQDTEKDLTEQVPPSFICADMVGWTYDLGDNEK